jgi:hypothetical protein
LWDTGQQERKFFATHHHRLSAPKERMTFPHTLTMVWATFFPASGLLENTVKSRIKLTLVLFITLLTL